MHSTDDLNDGYLGSGKYLWNSIKKYGKDNFKIEVLESSKNREELKSREKEIVNKDMLNEPLCMNIRPGGEGAPIGHQYYLSNIGSKRTDKTKEKMSIVQRGHKRNMGSKRSVETKRKMSENNTGQKNPFYGKHHSEVTKRKISAAGIGRSRPCSEETKIKLSIAAKKNTMTRTHFMKVCENFRRQKICTHCNRSFSAGNFAKYHGEKCKRNII